MCAGAATYTDQVPARLSAAVSGQLAESLHALRHELEIPEAFSPQALAEADAARPPEPALDLRELSFLTIDPPGSRDLDQAMHLARSRAGFVVRYAIADVPGFVRAGGALDAAARRRGQTFYAADGAVPLHPPIISEDRASLLPGVDRAAYVWSFELDASGAVVSARVERAMVRSRAKWDYATAQQAIDRGDAESSMALLPEIGRLRVDQERLRGGASLDLPDQEVVQDPAGGYHIERRTPLPVEAWNAQLSLMTGMAAAAMMLDTGVGILRTMPPPDDDAVAVFRAKTAALGLAWPLDQPYGEYLRSIGDSTPAELAVLQAAAGLFRGAGYAAFDGVVPEVSIQAAVAAPYAHVTAPLRRLVDRWGLVVCEAVSAGRPVASWARESLAEVPTLMDASNRRAGRLRSGTVDRVEAAVLSGHVGDRFEAIVIEARNGRARVQLGEPVVTASCPVPEDVAAGQRIVVRLDRADIGTGLVEFSIA